MKFSKLKKGQVVKLEGFTPTETFEAQIIDFEYQAIIVRRLDNKNIIFEINVWEILK